MRRTTVPILFLGLLLPVVALGQSIVTDSFYSQSLDRDVNVKIYLPEGYSTTGDPYRLIVYLHGGGSQNHNSLWPTMKPVLDAKILAGEIDPLIVVWPEGAGGPFYYNLHHWTDSERNGDYGSMVAEDLLAWLEASPDYNVTTQREFRAIGGFSMGGHGAAYLAIKRNDKFAAFMAHAGWLAFQEHRNWLPWILQECPESEPPFTFHPDYGYENCVWFSLAAAFSPNLESVPCDGPGEPPIFGWCLDFPITDQGIIDESVFTDVWVANHDPATLIQDEQTYVNDVGIYFDVGLYDDNLGFHQIFDEELNALGVPHTFNTFAGGHTFSASRVEVALDWLENIFDSAAVGVPDWSASGSGLVIWHEGVPNPFSDQMIISFSVPEDTPATLEIFDISGRRITTLFEGAQGPGIHKVEWAPNDLPAGVYLYRLKTRFGTASERIVLAR